MTNKPTTNAASNTTNILHAATNHNPTTTYTNSCASSIQQRLSKISKKCLNDWITNTYKPTHLLTIQLAENKKTNNFNKSKQHLKEIMVYFQKILVKNNWHKKHLKFICFAEHGKSQEWHFHILLNQQQYSNKELQSTINKLIKKFDLSSHNLDLQEIKTNHNGIPYYTTKEIRFNEHGYFDSDVMILSHDLYNLEVEKPLQTSLNQAESNQSEEPQTNISENSIKCLWLLLQTLKQNFRNYDWKLFFASFILAAILLL